jgi:dihydroorotate dehydrogenase
MRPSALDRLLTALDRVPTKPPVFLKFAADLRMDELHALIEVALSHHVQGLVLSNLTKDRAIQGITDAERDVWRQGGVGGRPVRARALALVREAYARCGGRLTLVGVGGISSAEDAYRRIRAGASLVQLVTGLVYEGPQLVGEINRGLAHRLRRDGFRSVAEAVGADHRP